MAIGHTLNSCFVPTGFPMGPCYEPLFDSLDSGGVCSMGPYFDMVHNGYIRLPD